MPTLYDTLLPLIQDITAEGGNFSAFLLPKPVLDAIDTGTPTEPALASLAGKIREAIAGCRGKRDHLGFNRIFEAYSEALLRPGYELRQLSPSFARGYLDGIGGGIGQIDGGDWSAAF